MEEHPLASFTLFWGSSLRQRWACALEGQGISEYYGDDHVESPMVKGGNFLMTQASCIWNRCIKRMFDGCLLFMPKGVCFFWSKVIVSSIPKARTKKRSEFSRNTGTHGRPHGFFKIASEIDTGTLPPNGRKHWRFLKKWRFSWSQDFFFGMLHKELWDIEKEIGMLHGIDILKR